jgi:hypothetical protein
MEELKMWKLQLGQLHITDLLRLQARTDTLGRSP